MGHTLLTIEQLLCTQSFKSKTLTSRDIFSHVQTEHSETMEACTNYISSGTQIWYNGKCISGSSRRPPTKMPVQKQQDFWQKWNELQEKQKR